MLISTGKLLLYGGLRVAYASLATSLVVGVLYIAVIHGSLGATSAVAPAPKVGCMPSHSRAKGPVAMIR